MKSRLTNNFIVVTAIFVGCLWSQSSATAQTKVVLIDVGMVFKNHPNFSQQLAALKTEADQFRVKADQVRQRLAKQNEELGLYQIGSDEYKALASKLAQEAAAINVEQNSQLHALMSREARLHFDTYKQVTGVIQEYCQQRGIQLVLRYNSERMDPAIPQSIMDKVNGSVVYHKPNKDVTAEIIRRVQQISAAAQPPGGTQNR